MTQTMNIHGVTNIDVNQKYWIVAPGVDAYPDGLVATRITIRSDSGDFTITAFGNDHGEIIPMERS